MRSMSVCLILVLLAGFTRADAATVVPSLTGVVATGADQEQAVRFSATGFAVDVPTERGRPDRDLAEIVLDGLLYYVERVSAVTEVKLHAPVEIPVAVSLAVISSLL